ncbi:MAG: hypothetical protein N2508_16305 [Anaerolineae bacterium]|nr:hypothetical protein [Anaerolineae bacterium]
MVNLPGNPVVRLDEYELRHLAMHLAENDSIEELHRLLALETNTHSNAWFDAKQAYDDVQGYLDDVSLAWRIAEGSYSPTDEPQEARSLGLQIRYALITSSVRSLISSIPPKLLAALADKGVWTSLRAFEYAKRTAYSVEALQRLAPYLEMQQLIEAIALVWNLTEDQRKWLLQLFDIAPEITTKLGREALLPVESQLESKVSLEQLLGNELAKLAEQLPNQRITDALRIAQELSSPAALPGLLSRLAAQGATREAIQIANGILDSFWRAKTLDTILPYLSEHERASIACREVHHVLQTTDLPEKFKVLALLIPHLPSEEPQEFREIRSASQEHFENVPLTRLAVTEKAIEIARKIDNKLWQTEALAHLVPALPEADGLSVLCEALSLVKAVEPESYRCQAIKVLAEHLQEPLWGEALDVVRSVQEPLWRCMTLKPLISKIPDSYLPDVFAILLDFQGWYERIETLKLLASRLTEPMLHGLLQTIYPAPLEDENDDKQDGDWYEKESILEVLVPYLSETLVREALAVATPKRRFFKMEPAHFRKMRGILIPQLARLGFPEEAMSMIREHEVELNAKIITEMARYLPEALLGELLAMTKNLSSEYEQRQAIEGLAPYLSPTLLQEALKIVSTVGDADQLGQALGKTANLLARLGYTQEAVEIVSRMEKATERARILREMIETSPEAGRPLILTEALKAARQIETIEEKVEAVTALMSHFSEAERLSFVNELLSEMERQKQVDLEPNSELSTKVWLDRQVKILTTLAEKLPEDKRQPLLAKALSLARGTEPVVSLPAPDPVEKFTKLDANQQVQIYSILRIIEKYPLIWRFLRSFLIIWATEDAANGIDGLFGLLTWVSGFERFSMLLDTYRIAWEIQDKEQRAQMFVKLVPLYPQGFIPVVFDQVLAAIRLIEDEIKQGVLLLEVMAYVSEDEHRKVWRELFRINPPKPWSPKDYEEPFIDMLVEMEGNRKWTDSFPSIVRHLVRKTIRRAKLKFPRFEPAYRPTKVSKTFLGQILYGKDVELRDRVQALTRIVALLPRMEREAIVSEVLQAVHTMDKEYDKADALLRLFPLCPESERLPIFQEAIAEVWKCGNVSMLFSSLVDLIPHLTETEKSMVIPEILRVVLKGGEDYGGSFNRGSEMLAELLPHLSIAQVYEALSVLRSCSVEKWRLAGTATIAAWLVKLGHVDEGFNLISKISDHGFHNVWWKGWVLGKVAFSLPKSLVRQALGMAQSLPERETGEMRTRAIAALSYRLAELGHIREALAILRESISGTMWYALALNAMTDLVSEQEQTDLIIESLSVARSLTDSSTRTEYLNATSSQWYKLPAVTRYSLWKEWLHDSATCTRADLLADISSLMPQIAVHGLGSALYEVGMAIQDVGRWWP